MRFTHQIVTIGDRNVTNTETLYTNSNSPKSSMKMLTKILKNVQYEIFDRETEKITIIN